jgi:hypothetical protein
MTATTARTSPALNVEVPNWTAALRAVVKIETADRWRPEEEVLGAPGVEEAILQAVRDFEDWKNGL